MYLHSGCTGSHSHQQLVEYIFANILLSDFWILVTLISDKWSVSVVLICPFDFIGWGWIVFFMLIIIHLYYLYVKCLFYSLCLCFMGFWSLSYWTLEALYILGKQLFVYMSCKYFFQVCHLYIFMVFFFL